MSANKFVLRCGPFCIVAYDTHLFLTYRILLNAFLYISQYIKGLWD